MIIVKKLRVITAELACYYYKKENGCVKYWVFHMLHIFFYCCGENFCYKAEAIFNTREEK